MTNRNIEPGHIAESDAGVAYCYGRRATKHISNGPHPTEEYKASSFCGGWFETEQGMERTYLRWNSPEVAARYTAQQRRLPTCRRCLKAARIDGCSPQENEA